MATSGGGKSQAMGLNPEIKKAQRVVFWDTHQSYKARRYFNLVEFGKALKAAENKTSFRIAYCGKASIETFNKFCRLVWAMADGFKVTYVGIDETAEVTEAIGKDKTPLGELMRGGRKYGLRVHVTAIRSAEIPKTVYSQAKIKWIGVLDSTSDAKVAADFLMIDYRQILDLDSMARHEHEAYFYVKYPGKTTELRKITTRKPPL
jgi:hypothetical protein